MLQKEQLITGILEINPSANRVWLERFDETALQRYLDRLQLTVGPRGIHSVWVRDGESPAVVTRRPAA